MWNTEVSPYVVEWSSPLFLFHVELFFFCVGLFISLVTFYNFQILHCSPVIRQLKVLSAYAENIT